MTVFHLDLRDPQGTKDELSVQVTYRFKMRQQAPKAMLAAIPNAGQSTAWEARERAREGMVKGFPDMLVLFDGRTLCLEFKSGTGRLSDTQHETLNRLHKLGFDVGVFRSAESALAWTRERIPDAFT